MRWSIVQEYEQDPMASDSDNAQKKQTGKTKGNQKEENKNTRRQFYTVILIHNL